MARKIAINGFGRIGRCVLRALKQRKDLDLDVVAINDLTDAKTLAHLLRYDSVHGTWDKSVRVVDAGLDVAGDTIRVSAEKDPAALPWKALGVEIVLECTGKFVDAPGCSKHVAAGAKRVLLSAPAKGENPEGVHTVVYGINHTTYDPGVHTVLSNASCTTNCLAPLVRVVHDLSGIRRGTMLTVHSYTNDQQILDLPHKDLRRAIGLVMPELRGRLDGYAIRVPTPNVSLVVLNAQVDKKTSKDEVNAALQRAAEGPLAGVLYTDANQLVSTDYIGNAASCTADLPLTQVIDGEFVSVSGWYDNEWGFSNRMLDTMAHMIKVGV